nr:MAG TPA: hypothetical protein [Caudoviricetes sp.]
MHIFLQLDNRRTFSLFRPPAVRSQSKRQTTEVACLCFGCW